MENLREENEDILKKWIRFREEDLLCHLTDEDRKYKLYFEEISEKIAGYNVLIILPSYF